MPNWFQPGRASVIVGGQFGSEAKGLAAAFMARYHIHEAPLPRMIIATTNAGAQAGHTTKYEDGTEWVCYHLPTTPIALIKDGFNNCTAYINSGAIVDIDLLRKEASNIHKAVGNLPWTYLNPHAAWIRAEEKYAEETAHDGVLRIASTSKGVGAALARKIGRKMDSVVEDCGAADRIFDVGRLSRINLTEQMMNGASVIVEIPQGTGLSIGTSGFYPYTTSRECWVSQGIADAGIAPRFVDSILMVVRTYPIRVGNTVRPDGGINSSGPFYSDGREISWGDLKGRAIPELTTVTKRVRRIAKFSQAQYLHGLMLNQPTNVMLTFVNYLESAKHLGELNTGMLQTETKARCFPTKIYSWGPNVEDCGSLRDAAAWLMARDRIVVIGARPSDTQAPDTPASSVAPSDIAGSVAPGDGTPHPEASGDGS